MARKNVTIRELRQAARDKGWLDVRASVYRSSVSSVTWRCEVTGNRGDFWVEEFVEVGFNSRQGAMRMALAALRAK